MEWKGSIVCHLMVNGRGSEKEWETRWHKMCHWHMSVLSTVHDNWHNNTPMPLTQRKRTHYIILSNTAYIYKNWCVSKQKTCFSFTVHNIPWSRDPKCQLQIVETRNGQTASKEGLVYVYVYFFYYKCIFNLAWS